MLSVSNLPQASFELQSREHQIQAKTFGSLTSYTPTTQHTHLRNTTNPLSTLPSSTKDRDEPESRTPQPNIQLRLHPPTSRNQPFARHNTSYPTNTTGFPTSSSRRAIQRHRFSQPCPRTKRHRLSYLSLSSVNSPTLIRCAFSMRAAVPVYVSEMREKIPVEDT
ncbi:uncharacterized protein BDV17DRAFT_64035 [Aspergillus undulatus]|uniref:uncharacterized protein n=1 Tax=Aspergillus undulatus TaxID=1810928 RepID=UPI003CCCCBC5